MLHDILRAACGGISQQPAGSPVYWRINIAENFGGSSGYEAAIVEVEFRAAIGGASVSTGGVAMASSYVATYNEPSAAFDAADSTRWSSERYVALPQWIGYQHADGVDVVEVAIKASNLTHYLACAPKSFSIEYSSGGSVWVPVAEFTNEPAWSALEQRVYAI